MESFKWRFQECIKLFVREKSGIFSLNCGILGRNLKGTVIKNTVPFVMCIRKEWVQSESEQCWYPPERSDFCVKTEWISTLLLQKTWIRCRNLWQTNAVWQKKFLFRVCIIRNRQIRMFFVLSDSCCSVGYFDIWVMDQLNSSIF